MSWALLTAAVQKAAFAVFREPSSQPVLYRPGGGTTTIEVRGIFRAPFQGVDLNLQAEVASSAPRIGFRDAELAELGITPSSDDLVDVRGETFALSDRQPDGEGVTTFALVGARTPA